MPLPFSSYQPFQCCSQPRMKMITKNLLFILFLISLHSSYALNPPHNCSPSACGNIPNISFPFRLKHDPKNCGCSEYELACENDIPLIYFNSHMHQVKAINYEKFTIRLADVSINSTNTCSFPTYSAYPYYLIHDLYSYRTEVAWPINYMSCPYPLKNSSFLTLTNDCVNVDASNTTTTRHVYIKVGHMKASEVQHMCSLDRIAMTSWKFDDLKNVSISEIHNSLLYGFELSWHRYPSTFIRFIRKDHNAICPGQADYTFIVMNVLVKALFAGASISAMITVGFTCAWVFYFVFRRNRSVAFVFAGVSIPAMIIILGFSCALYVFYFVVSSDRFVSSVFAGVSISAMITVGLTCAWVFCFVFCRNRSVAFVFAGVSIPAMIIILGFTCALVFYVVSFVAAPLPLNRFLLSYIGLIYSARNIILFPCMIGFLIYKFRRRHLSMYDEIEEFLQSDNKLMPIRYSYSNIKKMTRDFGEKLGQGGYGTVYKGKLRSGYDVAVKLLGKPGGKDQDFMNEISTIGRIHHVNVVNLVGYCAERSKRALVFDFMPNGSLDKYILGREKKINCLNWERKYDIAVGVARGIEYLHRGCDIQILHFDIKPHNILLDHNFTPKITDFGLAKFYSTDKSTVTMTAARGTIGYVAPELINRGFGEVSYKADVYSFGMLLMEIVGLNRDFKGSSQASSQYFPCWIYNCFDRGQDIEIGVTDENNDEDNNDTNKKIARKMTIVALWCTQMSPNDRPSMNKVVEMLEAPVERLRVPNRPSTSQSAQVAVNYEDQSWSTYSTDSTSLVRRDAASSIEITVEDLKFETVKM